MSMNWAQRAAYQCSKMREKHDPHWAPIVVTKQEKIRRKRAKILAAVKQKNQSVVVESTCRHQSET